MKIKGSQLTENARRQLGVDPNTTLNVKSLGKGSGTKQERYQLSEENGTNAGTIYEDEFDPEKKGCSNTAMMMLVLLLAVIVFVAILL